MLTTGWQKTGRQIMYSKNDKKLTAVYSVTHFLVDLACIFMVTAFIIPVLGSRMDWLWCMLTYNFCAFAMQMPIGAVIDRAGRPQLFASAGCLMIAVSYIIAMLVPHISSPAQSTNALTSVILPIMACMAAGIGNSCFHAGGGVSILGISRQRAALSGIYVSTGAFGVYLAPKLAAAGGQIYRWSALAGIAIMLISAAVLYNGHRKNFADPAQISAPEPSRAHHKIAAILFTAVMGLFLTVCIRSYIGTVMKFSWKSVPVLGLLFTAGIVFGKMAGGIVGDRFGWGKVSVGSLAVSAVLLIAAGQLPWAGIIGVFLFNMTMPITLTALANIFEQNHGFAFGVTTFALFLGTLPSMLGDKTDAAAAKWVIPLVVLSSAVFLGIGLICYNRIQKNR